MSFDIRSTAHALAVTAIVLGLVALSVVAVSAARDARTTAADVRQSTGIWNAYQQARYSVVQEALHTQDFRLTGSPAYEGRFREAATTLEQALGTVEESTRPNDRRTAAQIRETNAQIARAVPLLVAAVKAGNAAKAERIATKRLDPLFDSSITTVDRAANLHRDDARAGLLAAQRSESVIVTSAAAVFILGGLLAITTLAAMRIRRRLDDARRDELERLLAAAHTDSLTGVLNHRAFHEHLAEVLGTAGAQGSLLLIIDLDGLKAVNDSYGHQVGDEQIKLLATTVVRTVGAAGRLYRLGGDEFALVLPTSTTQEAVQLTEAAHHFLGANPNGLQLDFTAGIARHKVGMNKDELIRRADLALIEAKRIRQRALVYSPVLEVVAVAEPEEFRHVQVLANALARAVDTKDAYTNSHCKTVAELCALMAAQLGFDQEQIFKLRLAGLLHDVGKIGVPDSILQKPGPLTEDEYAVMKAHPALGAHILSAAERRAEAGWVLRHHERPDGKGYPHGITDVPVEASIIAVADAFEAMISERPYRAPRPVEEALEELSRCSGTQFDPQCVAALARVLGKSEQIETPLPVDPSKPVPLVVAAA
jgi:diguanylate cyclase (GGDEF)-like protein/putative nucleotidyltransferase with HDIG domain